MNDIFSLYIVLEITRREFDL